MRLEPDARAILVRVKEKELLLGAAALFILLSVAYSFSIDIRASRGASITGDEPFYLLTTQSLLQDGDLDLVNQYDNRSYESFFDHPDGLWRQSTPSANGRLLSPHNPGLSVLLIPGFALGGLPGTQVQLLLIAAAAMTLAFVLADRLTNRRGVSWAVTLAVGISATPFIYSTEVYPEFPAALVLLACLLVATRKGRLPVAYGVWMTVGLSALCWLGVKYVPLALLVAAYFLYKANGQARGALLVLGGASGAVFIWFHLATFDSLTPYNVNVVYAGLSSVELVDHHVAFGDRFYRLWGLFVDQRFGAGRWAPLLLVAIPGLSLLVLGNARLRLILGLIALQVAIATFVAITMMGWWFPGRTLLTVLPLFVVPLVLMAVRMGQWVRWGMGVLTVYSVAVTAGLAYAGHAREITIAVDPFDMGFLPFRALSHVFPNYTHWDGETWTLTILWLVVAAVAVSGTVLRLRIKSRTEDRNPARV